jgi:FkbM family methyltransferase
LGDTLIGVKLRRAILVIAVLLAAAVAAWAYYPPFRLLTLYAAGRSPACPLNQAVQCGTHIDALKAANDRIIQGSKLVQSDPAGFDLYATPNGNWWIPAGDRWVLPFNLAEQQVDIYGTSGRQPVRSGDIVLDCGANVGVFTRKALDHGAAKVIAIEPAPENLECLRRNFSAEIASGKVVLYPKGVWDKDDVLEMNIDPKNSAGDSFVIQREGSHKISLPLTTIDKLVTELALPRVDYIKMDIEGAEPNALSGARRTLAKWKPRLSLAAYHEPDHPVRIPAIIRAVRADYEMECGPCEEHNGRIVPDILYFR